MASSKETDQLTHTHSVRATALAALDWGFETILVPEAMRSVGGKEAEEKVFAEIEHLGGKVVPLGKLKGVLGM